MCNPKGKAKDVSVGIDKMLNETSTSTSTELTKVEQVLILKRTVDSLRKAAFRRLGRFGREGKYPQSGAPQI